MGLGPSYPPGAIVVPASVAGSPFVDGHLVYISGGKLKSIANSIVVNGGLATESVALGGTGTNSTQIGSGALAKNTNTIVIGGNSTVVAGAGSDVVVVGTGNVIHADSARGIVLGNGNTGMSAASVDTFIVLAHGLTSTVNPGDMFIGGQGGKISRIYLGSGAVNNPVGNVEVVVTASSSSSGANLTLHPGDGFTGNRAGYLIIRSKDIIGATSDIFLAGHGSSPQDSAIFVFRGYSSAGFGATLILQTSGGVQLGAYGYAGLASALIGDCAVQDNCMIAYQGKALRFGASVDGTNPTVSAVAITAADIILDARTGNLRFNNFTNGAGAAAGTLANAPVAGNPAFWLRVSIAGTVRYIPCW